MAAHHPLTHKVQDPYSIRCVPQVHGAVLDALDHLRRVLDVEMNAATDNPLVFPEGGVADVDVAATGGGRVISGGNFHGEPIALALDFAKLASPELGAISERRTALLLDGRLNGGLPAFLTADGGLNSGLMLLQYTAAALASENKVLAHPAIGRLDPDQRQPGGPCLDGRHRRPARATRARQRGSRSWPSRLLCAAQALDFRLAEAAGSGAGSRCSRCARPGPCPGRAPDARPRAGARHRGGDRARPRSGAARALVAFVDSRSWPSGSSTSRTRRHSALVPPCADPAFDHRSCDYWEDADRGSKAARA